MSPNSHYVEDPNLSVAWARAVRPMLLRGGPKELVPLIVSVTGFAHGVPHEDVAIRSALDRMLATQGEQTCETVANTIFPSSLWNPRAQRSQLFERYRRILPKLLDDPSRKNKRGLYFDRMINGGPEKQPNQLEFVIDAFTERANVRRGLLQVAIFDPKRDHTKAARLGFPCLQHITFAPADGGLAVNAFYATQFAFSRAYGNYLGICRLGRFVAHELKIPLVRMTCFTGISMRALGPGALRQLGSAVEARLGKD